jgi:hypothetical protein
LPPPGTPEGIVEQEISGLASTMTRRGDGLQVVAALVNVRPTDIRSLLQGPAGASEQKLTVLNNSSSNNPL